MDCQQNENVEGGLLYFSVSNYVATLSGNQSLMFFSIVSHREKN